MVSQGEALAKRHYFLNRKPLVQPTNIRSFIMSMLNRYKKTGGFVQLVSLIETLGPNKQEKFLNMIQEEDAAWMDAVKQKMLTIDKIFSWSDDTVSEIVRRLPTKSLASAIKALKEDQVKKVFCLMSNSEKRKIEDEIATLSDKPEEAQANVLKLIETTRKMITDTDLRVESFAPEMAIEEGIEAKLAAGPKKDKPAPVKEVTPPITTSVVQLQNMVAALTRENNQLKSEVKLLKQQLEQLKKAA